MCLPECLWSPIPSMSGMSRSKNWVDTTTYGYDASCRGTDWITGVEWNGMDTYQRIEHWKPTQSAQVLQFLCVFLFSSCFSVSLLRLQRMVSWRSHIESFSSDEEHINSINSHGLFMGYYHRKYMEIYVYIHNNSYSWNINGYCSNIYCNWRNCYLYTLMGTVSYNTI